MSEQKKEMKILKVDSIVEKLVPDPSQPPISTVMLSGYLGRSTVEGVWRLYLTKDLNDYIEIQEVDIVHNEQSEIKGTTLWIKRDATVNRVQITSKQQQASFLDGDISSNYLNTAQQMSTLGQVQIESTTVCQVTIQVCPNITRACPPPTPLCWSQGVCPTKGCTEGCTNACPTKDCGHHTRANQICD